MYCPPRRNEQQQQRQRISRRFVLVSSRSTTRASARASLDPSTVSSSVKPRHGDYRERLPDRSLLLIRPTQSLYEPRHSAGSFDAAAAVFPIRFIAAPSAFDSSMGVERLLSFLIMFLECRRVAPVRSVNAKLAGRGNLRRRGGH